MSQAKCPQFAMTAAKAVCIIGLSGLLVAPLAGTSQTAGRTLRIAILDDASEETRAPHWRLFRSRLRELGYAEGKNLLIEARYAQGAAERLFVLAEGLVALKPDIVVATSTAATRAGMRATSTVPIVFVGIGDPVAAGLVGSLPRPGGNVTGLSVLTGEVGAKWIELLREIVPGAKRLAYLGDTTNPGSVEAFNRLREHASLLEVSLEMFDGKPKGLERSFEAIARERFAGLVVGIPAVMLDGRDRIVQFAARQKLPTVYARREYADAGGLLSYGPELSILYARTAEYVHRIAQGAKPADMPVERPSTVRMVLNLKTSRALGIAIPPSIRHRADDLID